jgi:hypothetical protein
VLVSLLCLQNDTVKIAGEFLGHYTAKTPTTSEAGGIEESQNFSLGFKLSDLETFWGTEKLLSLSVMFCLLFSMMVQYHYHVCYRTRSASVVEPAKALKQTGRLATMQELVARSSSGQDDPTPHQALMISS